jgi:hypothetical protein
MRSANTPHASARRACDAVVVRIVVLVCLAVAPCGSKDGGSGSDNTSWLHPSSTAPAAKSSSAGAGSAAPGPTGRLQRLAGEGSASKPAKPGKTGKRKGGSHSASGGRSSDVTPTATPDDEDNLPEHGRANGVACNYDSDCKSGECSFDHCRGKDDKKGNGVACSFDSDCESDDCSFGHCRGKDDKKGNGVACSFDSECESDKCSFQVCADND